MEYRAQSNATSERERAKTVAAYYNQPAIEAAAKKVGRVVLAVSAAAAERMPGHSLQVYGITSLVFSLAILFSLKAYEQDVIT